MRESLIRTHILLDNTFQLNVGKIKYMLITRDQNKW